MKHTNGSTCCHRGLARPAISHIIQSIGRRYAADDARLTPKSGRNTNIILAYRHPSPRHAAVLPKKTLLQSNRARIVDCLAANLGQCPRIGMVGVADKLISGPGCVRRRADRIRQTGEVPEVNGYPNGRPASYRGGQGFVRF
jgi:hypothetical protein